jgi:hypothetical protein
VSDLHIQHSNNQTKTVCLGDFSHYTVYQAKCGQYVQEHLLSKLYKGRNPTCTLCTSAYSHNGAKL